VVKEISHEELKARMDRADDFYLVEALSRRHYEMSHLQGRSTPLRVHGRGGEGAAGQARRDRRLLRERGD
jgi:hypothetical protein